MARNALKDAFLKALKDAPLSAPWNLLDKQIPYDQDKYRHTLRPGSSATNVRIVLRQPVVQAIWQFTEAEIFPQCLPFRLVKRSAIGSSGVETQFVSEIGLADGTSLVATATQSTVCISHCEADGSHTSITAFRNESAETLTALMLVILPLVQEIDLAEGNGKLQEAMNTIAAATGASTWTDRNDIPELVQTALYFSDIVHDIIKSKLDLEFNSNPASNAAQEIPDASFASAEALTGALLCEYLKDSWEPKFVKVSGTATRPASQKMTILEAKKKFCRYSAHRKWSAEEEKLICQFPDDTPVMQEAIFFAEMITGTTGFENPTRNIMWRGATSYGKSYGVRQLSCILNMPLLTMACHTNTEEQDFKSTYVPVGSVVGIDMDVNGLHMPSGTFPHIQEPKSPLFREAMAYLVTLPADEIDQILDPEYFYLQIQMDLDEAAGMLLGREETSLGMSQLFTLYQELCVHYVASGLKDEITRLKCAGNTGKNKEKPGFQLIIADYTKALVNGYIIEVQEPSRIMHQGVLVGLNNLNAPGSLITLANGQSRPRHKDAICICTDNVGYNTCKQMDNSFIRRQDFVIDSYELSRESVLDRIRRNTGCNDEHLLDLAYNLWSCVKDYCETNGITEGSVSPSELEAFVKSVMILGPDSIGMNLNYSIISKASSSIEDQREIRSACSTIYSVIAA